MSMKYINKVKVAIVACGALAATACTDYLDYNQVPQSTDPTADKTLWENIASPGISLEGMMLKLKLQYFGHLMRRVCILFLYRMCHRQIAQ